MGWSGPQHTRSRTLNNSPFATADTIRKQAFTQIASPDWLKLRQIKVEKVDPPKIRYPKSFQKARIHSKTKEECSIESLEKRMVLHKFDHEKYDPMFLAEQERAAIIAILSRDQDVREHLRNLSQR